MHAAGEEVEGVEATAAGFVVRTARLLQNKSFTAANNQGGG
jgi:hypothetical protein